MPIRHAVVTDLPAIVEIYNTSIAGRMSTADLEPVTVESRKAWFADYNPQTRPLWVLEEEGKIAGWLGLRSFYGRPAYHGTVEVAVYVAPAFQGQGVGRWLLAHACAQAPQLGIRTLLGYVFAHNAISISLFQALGFERWGELPNVAELDGVERSVLIFGRRIA